MNNKKISLLAFIVLAIIQIAIPSWMILHRENVKSIGKVYRFECRPIDPNDPFRGKYVTLGFEADQVKNVSNQNWVDGEFLYALLAEDAAGFAYIQDLSRSIPSEVDYIQVEVLYSSSNNTTVKLPFDRYYMEESKAPKAERLYRSRLRDAEIVALVNVLDGSAVLTNVLIDNVPIKDAVASMVE